MQRRRHPPKKRPALIIEVLELRMLLNGSQIVLGPPTDLFDQPYVDMELRDATHSLGLGPYGTGTFGLYPYNHVLLDTGANSISLVSDAAQELVKNGLQNVGTFSDIGVAGSTEFELSQPYQLNFTGTTGTTQTLPQTIQDVRILTNPSFEFGAAAADGGIPGLIGMPAMVGRVTTLDTSPLANFEPLGVSFSNSLPEGNGHRFSAATDTRVTFNPRDGLPSGSPSDAPVPSWAPVTFVTATIEAQGISKTGNFLVDTGAQMSVMSPKLAFSLGLDTNHNGSLLDEAIDTVPITGVGGTVELPVLAVDKLSLSTEQGPDLTWEETGGAGGLGLLVEDIAPGIDGVLGADLLTSGLSLDYNTLDVIGKPYFDKIHLDFRNLATQGSGQLVFDLNPQYDTNVRTWTAAAGGNWSATANWSGGATPQPGDMLLLKSAQPETIINNLPAGRSVGAIFTNGDVTLAGNPIVLDAGGSTAIRNVAGDNALAIQSQLGSDGTVRVSAGQLAITGGIDTNAHQLRVEVAGGAMARISGAITGTGGLQKEGSGTLTLSGANTYSGGTMVVAGTLVATTSQSIADGSLTVAAGGVLIFDPTAAAAKFSGSATWTSISGSAWNDSANWVDVNGLAVVPGTSPRPDNTDVATFSGSGTVTAIDLTGAAPSLHALNFNASSYTLSGGSLTLKSDTGTATVTVGGGTQSLGSQLTLASRTVMDVSNGARMKISGNIGQNGVQSLTKVGSGTLTLSGVNTYSGGTMVMAGTLVATTAQSIPNGALTVGAGGTLIFDPSVTTSPISVLSPVMADASTSLSSSVQEAFLPGHATLSPLPRFPPRKVNRSPAATAELPPLSPGVSPTLAARLNAAADAVLAAGISLPIRHATNFWAAAAMRMAEPADPSKGRMRTDVDLLTQMTVLNVL